VKPPWYRSKKRKNKNKISRGFLMPTRGYGQKKRGVDLNLPLNYSNAYR
jgi:hypothetical protein